MSNRFTGISADQAFGIAIAESGALLFESDITSAARFAAIHGLAEELAEARQYSVLDEWLRRAGRLGAPVYELIADVMEADLGEQTLPSDIGADARSVLYVCPVLVPHLGPAPLTADWVDSLPPFDVRFGSHLAPVLIGIDELLRDGDQIRTLHLILNKYRSAASAPQCIDAITSWCARTESRGSHDNVFVLADGRSVSLRFLAVSRLDQKRPLFADEAAAQEWAAQSQAITGLDIKPPRELARGLYVGQTMAQELVIRELLRHVESSYELDGALTVLLEDFGLQGPSISLGQRISVFQELTEPWIVRATVVRRIASDRARWRHNCEQLRDRIQSTSPHHLVFAPMVQPVELLPQPPEARLLQAVLGPSAAFEQSAPDGLPFEGPSEDQLNSNWWSFLREGQESDCELVAAVVATVLDVPKESLAPKAAFILTRGRWYSSVVLDFGRIPTSDGTELHWPPDQSLLDSANAMIGFTGALKWVSLKAIAP